MMRANAFKKFVGAASVAVVLCVGSVSAQESIQARLVKDGNPHMSWVDRDNGMWFAFRADGTFAYDYPCTHELQVRGTYTIDGSTVTFKNDSGQVISTATFAFSENNTVLTLRFPNVTYRTTYEYEC